MYGTIHIKTCLNALSRWNLNLNTPFDKQICPSNWDSNDQGTKDV